MSCTPEHVKTEEPAQPDEFAWWQEILSLGDAEDGAEPHPDDDLAALEPACPSFENGDRASNEAESFSSAAGEHRGAAHEPERRPRHVQTYTLEKVNELAGALRALPAKDPSERRLDKQAVIRHIVQEITALQVRGYTLEEVARSLTTEGVEVTLPTLKSYLQRARKASAKGVKKGPQRAALPLVLTRGVR
jgi:hypothetical protein